MEGVIRYRILGSHPAASGRYYTTGFSGESMLVQQLLDDVVKEHQINLSAFKAVVTRVPPVGAGGVGGGRQEDGGITEGSSNTAGGPPQVLYPRDQLQNYDSIAITISKRALADGTDTAEQERHAALESRLRAVGEEPFSAGAAALALSGVTDVVGLSSATLSASGGPGGGGADSCGGRGRATGASQSRARAVDTLALQRAMSLASKVFPVRPGQRSGLERRGDAAKDQACVLCELPAFQPLFTSCCHWWVCRTCFDSGQAMMTDSDGCPVCGRNEREAGGGAPGRGKRPRKDSGETGVKEEVKVGGMRLSTGSSGLPRPRTGPVGGQEERKVRLQWGSEGGAGRAGPPAAPSASDAWSPSSPPVGSSPSAARGGGAALSPAVLQVGTELAEALDRALAQLGARRSVPVTERAGERRVKSAALAALDAEDVALAE